MQFFGSEGFYIESLNFNWFPVVNFLFNFWNVILEAIYNQELEAIKVTLTNLSGACGRCGRN